MKYSRKPQEVEAFKHLGTSSLVVVGKKGEQSAKTGDYIIIDGPTPNDREVLSAEKFHALYEPSNPLDKTSGVDGDAGGWTEAGDGIDYPGQKVIEPPPAPISFNIVTKEDGTFDLFHGHDFIGNFPTKEDAEKAQEVAK